MCLWDITLVFAAAQQYQSALDVQDTQHPHGLFTEALVQALEVLPAGSSATDILRRVQVDMELSGNDQQPALDGSDVRKAQPVFGGTAEDGPPRAAVVSVLGQDAVADIGVASDVGVGSEFSMLAPRDGRKTILRLTGSTSLTRSNAKVIGSDEAVIRAKDIVELTKWVPGPRPALNLYVGPSNRTLEQLMAARDVLRGAGVRLGSYAGRGVLNETRGELVIFRPRADGSAPCFQFLSVLLGGRVVRFQFEDLARQHERVRMGCEDCIVCPPA
jgi:hypothetical protein